MRNDERVLRALSQVAGPVIAADLDGRIRQVSVEAAEVIGHRPQDLLEAPLTMIMPERFRARHLEAFRRYAQTGVSRLEGQPVRVAALDAQGQERPIDLTIRIFRGPGPAAMAVGLVAAGITEHPGMSMIDVERELSQSGIRRL